MRAHELLRNPGSWTQGALAANVDGETCNPQDTQATKWCAVGAMWCCYWGDEYRDKKDMLRAKVREMGFSSVEDWNDNHKRTHADVVSLLNYLDI
jgi:hypothetical protein